MGKGLLTMIGLGAPEEAEQASEDSYQDRKTTAAEEAIQAIQDEDPEAFADAITAMVRVCKLEGLKSKKVKAEIDPLETTEEE